MAGIVLAQEGGRSAAIGGFLWIGGIAVAVVVAIIVASRLRRSVTSSPSVGDVPFTLEEIRRLRDSGDLTAAEYEALRDRVIHETPGA